MPTRRRPARRTALLLAGALLAAGGLAGCSGDDEGDEGSSTTPSAEPSDYLPVPEGVELTPQGSALELGETAVVAWQPEADKVGVVELTVTAFERLDVDALSSWQLDRQTRRSTPYFVTSTVANVGRGNLADVTLPLYLADGADTLVPASTFESLFRPCPSRPLPTPFRPGDRTALCQLFLLPPGGSFQGVSFYPGPGFDPITWSGQVTKPKPEQPDQKGDRQSDSQDG